MSVQHRKDSIKSLRLAAMGITPPDDWGNLEQVRVAKRYEMGAAATAAIHAGVEVDGKHYSLTEHDQKELMGQLAKVQAGAPYVPYHADGELCRMFSAAEFLAVVSAAMQHIFWHRTYVNHLNAWIRRGKLKEVIPIYYGIDLPKDLAKNLAELIEKAGDLF